MVEMVPYAVLGIILFNLKTMNVQNIYKIYFVIGSSLLLNLFLKFDFFIVPEKGFGYQGIELIVIGCLLLILFYFLPLERIPIIMKKFILEVSKHTMGIYFMHRLVGMIFYNTRLSVWLKMKQGTIYDCCIIFVTSYVISRIIYRIPIKWAKMSVS